MEYKIKYADGCRNAVLPQCGGSDFHLAERQDIVAMIAADPECGEVMQGTGGFRKVRVGRGGMGKRGGARVVYIRPQ